MTDPHAPAKAATLATAEECDGWITACRARGDETKASLGVARRAEIMRRGR